MVVNNQMMDQLLVNTAVQAPQTPNASKPKDAQNPDFDSMVNQRRSADAKPNARDAKAEKPEKIAGTEETKEPVQVTDEQYAIAAAMMMQAQTIPPEMVTAENAVETETVLTVDAGEQPDMPELTLDTPAQEAAPETAVAADTQATPKPVKAPKEADAPVQQKAETVGETRTDRPVEAKPQTQEPQRKPDEPQEQPQQTIREDAPRTEDVPEQQPRFVRTEAKPQTEDETAVTDDAQTAQAAPLFQNVEAPVVKVAEASRPIPLETEDGVEQLAREIDTIVVNDVSANRIEVTLTPENLGKLTVEITRGEDGNLSIVLHTTTERAANLLEKHTANLQNALASNNRENVEVQVKPSGEPEQQFLNPDGRNEQNRQQQQQQHSRREQTNAQDFLQQLRLGLVGSDNDQ